LTDSDAQQAILDCAEVLMIHPHFDRVDLCVALQKRGFSEHAADRLLRIVPLAFLHDVVAQMGFPPPTSYRLGSELRRFDVLAEYRAARLLCGRWRNEGRSIEQLARVYGHADEVEAISGELADGQAPTWPDVHWPE
jgi:hypothetical protein